MTWVEARAPTPKSFLQGLKPNSSEQRFVRAISPHLLRKPRRTSICWLLRGSVLRDQDHAEARFAFHHASVTLSRLFERNCLDHRADILEDAEGESVLVINGRAGQATVDRAPSKDERERAQLNGVERHTHHDELAASGKTGYKLTHAVTAGSCGENGSRAAHTLQHRSRIVDGGIDVNVCAQIFCELFLVATTPDGDGTESHVPRKLHTQMTKSADALHRDQISAAQASITKSIV